MYTRLWRIRYPSKLVIHAPLFITEGYVPTRVSSGITFEQAYKAGIYNRCPTEHLEQFMKKGRGKKVGIFEIFEFYNQEQ
jgi:hypothetical protein